MSERRSPRGLSTADIRTALGNAGNAIPDDLADRVPEVFDVDVITTDLVGDGYLMCVGARSVIVGAKTDSWFRQNFTIAHELGHVAVGSLCDGQLHAQEGDERAANRFAADLLLPAEEVRSLDWSAIALPVLAEKIWAWGVSTQMVSIRLSALGITARAEVKAELDQYTRGFLRHHLRVLPGEDVITVRSDRASRRRFPTDLLSRLENAVSKGRAPREALAFALGVDVNQLDEENPPKAHAGDDVELFEGLE